ncbi:MAG: NADH-quinone oxidoreductase subunit NuoG [Acidiphilium sp.]|nr:NADH-quinone oxidoreductase subunit NuoG [Acidiphilium sp.]MDD4936567.1 NADH-quinone oxidoreductase subunit NuoG [Acidiphilium sp.]
MDLNHLDLTVDQIIITARPGQNILEACLSAQQDIPYFCWHPALGSVGACRQCAVKVFSGPEDQTGQIVMACMTPVTPGMRLSIADPAVAQFRDRVIEFVLTNHPHDCPVCEVGGECHLQDMTALVKHDERRYRFTKRTHLNQNLGPFIRHEMNRCIGCYRCARFYRDYAGGRDFGVFGSNRNIYFGRAESGTLESEFAGNLVEVCPTGVFVDKPFSARFRRKWDMRATPSICPHCAVGCNITVQEREGEFRRVTNRYNETLNGYFLCDRGRFGTGFLESDARLRGAKRRQDGNTTVAIELAEARADLAARLNHDGVIGIGSPRASLEANFALRAVVGADHFYAGVSDQDAAVLDTAIRLMRDHAMPIASLADTENADAALILGDDPSDIAPRLALSLRQLGQRATTETLAARQIPAWNDTPARLAAEGHRTPLMIATPMATRLDDCAAISRHLTPNAIIALAFALAHRLDDTAPGVASDDPVLAGQIAGLLCHAASPVIVVGGNTCGSALLLGAANLVIALRRAGSAARLLIMLPEVNSVGLGLLAAKPLSAALAAMTAGTAKRVIVLENDLHRRAEVEALEWAFATVDSLCVLDHIETPTTGAADLAIGVGSFADSDCTFVNLEGRAQRGFKAIFSPAEPPQSWQVLRDAGLDAGRIASGSWHNHAALIEAITIAIPSLAGCTQVWPDAPYDDMQRPATLPHRYSGRTAVNADRNVREPKPFANPDSPLGTTMEGAVLRADSALVPYFWSPGWNSAQAVNKYQSSIGGQLASGGAGILLFGGSAGHTGYFPMPPLVPPSDQTVFLPVTRVFGSEELSALSPAVAARMSAPSVSLNPQEAARLALTAGDRVDCTIGTTVVSRVVSIEAGLANGIAGLTIGFPGEAGLNLPGVGDIHAVSGDPS